MTKLNLVVAATTAETTTIRRVDLRAIDGGGLPAFDAGAHITINVPGVGARKYSLIDGAFDAVRSPAPPVYTIGVRLEPQSEGGSRYVHALATGDVVAAEAPQNNFPLKATEGRSVLVAGGIGVTPLITMAAELRRSGRPLRMIYAARSVGELAFRREIEAITGSDLIIHTDDTAGRLFDMATCFAGLQANDRVYMCGPKPMLKAGMDAAKRLGWPRDRLSFELFYSVATPVPPAAPSPPTDGSFEVVLKSSGKSYRIPPDKSILDVLVANDLDPMHDCKRGECGVCQVGVIEGVPDHKDVILSDSERAANKVMQICISRAKSARLVLDL